MTITTSASASTAASASASDSDSDSAGCGCTTGWRKEEPLFRGGQEVIAQAINLARTGHCWTGPGDVSEPPFKSGAEQAVGFSGFVCMRSSSTVLAQMCVGLTRID